MAPEGIRARLSSMNKRLTKVSKYLTFILRHEPESIGVTLDANGSVDVEELVAKAKASGKSITVEQVHQVVAENEQQLFSVSDDKARLRMSDASAS